MNKIIPFLLLFLCGCESKEVDESGRIKVLEYRVIGGFGFRIVEDSLTGCEFISQSGGGMSLIPSTCKEKAANEKD